jgi:hypothetical protein
MEMYKAKFPGLTDSEISQLVQIDKGRIAKQVNVIDMKGLGDLRLGDLLGGGSAKP